MSPSNCMTAHHGYSEGERPRGEMDMFEPLKRMASLSISVKQALPWSGMKRDARRDGVPVRLREKAHTQIARQRTKECSCDNCA
ncbi:MAG: hypothetical protein A4E65_03681 [Syntrophorhabdus sp. PtaU1.Bin153]|nr:MAG: hypothetical protein A4E65_03681 [Syntrophorhabdus sp. PtaU1.Bin153]